MRLKDIANGLEHWHIPIVPPYCAPVLRRLWIHHRHRQPKMAALFLRDRWIAIPDYRK